MPPGEALVCCVLIYLALTSDHGSARRTLTEQRQPALGQVAAPIPD
jgi:hypothetical protein